VDLWLVTISLSQQEGENLENIKRYDRPIMDTSWHVYCLGSS